jgi:hypothetical protein
MTPMGTFPQYAERLQALVEQHKQLEQETLLAVYYESPQRCENDVCLFEVIEDFGLGDIDPHRELFEVAYAGTEAFPLPAGQYLRLTLTNPQEFEAAREQAWEQWLDLRKAVERGQFKVLHSADLSWSEVLDGQRSPA